MRSEARGIPRPGELGEGRCFNTGGLQGGRTHGAMRLEDGGDDLQGGRHHFLGDWPGGGLMEGYIRHHQSLIIVFHLVS